jgi:Glycolipid transfer protein (GLTP)
MVKHELAEKAIKFKAKDDSTGTRNLLRLHRALEFIVLFMESLGKLDDDEKCVGVAHDAYKVTMTYIYTLSVTKLRYCFDTRVYLLMCDLRRKSGHFETVITGRQWNN